MPTSAPAATTGARSAAASRGPARDWRGDALPGLLLLVSLLFALRRPAVAARRRPRPRRCRCSPSAGVDFLTSAAVVATRRRPASARASSGRSADRRHRRARRFPLGIATAVYLEEYAPDNRLHAAHRHQHPQPRRRPVDRLRPARPAVFVALFTALGVGNGRNVIAGGLTSAVLVLPDRDHHGRRGAARRAADHPRGGLRRRRVALGGDPQARPAGRVPGHPHRHRPGALARARRDGAADPRRRGPAARSPAPTRGARRQLLGPVHGAADDRSTTGPRCPRRSSGS